MFIKVPPEEEDDPAPELDIGTIQRKDDRKRERNNATAVAIFEGRARQEVTRWHGSSEAGGHAILGEAIVGG
jgi:hypothetical protein